MPRPIAISLSPNTEPDDIRRAWQTLLKPQAWKKPNVVDALEKQLTKYLNNYSVAMVSSGRRALYDVMKAYDIGKHDEVILQAFTCIAVPAAVQWTGATAVYADIDKSTLNLDLKSVENKITSRTKAIIIQHTLGIPGPVTELAALARKKNIIFIEDCAHGFGATYQQQPLGTYGDAAIVSFGRDKTLSCIFGGAVISKNPKIIKAIRRHSESLVAPPAQWIVQQLLHPILMNAAVKLYFTAALGKIFLVAMQKLGLLSKAVAPQEKTGEKPVHFSYRFSPALGQLLELQLSKLDRYTLRRRQIARRYMQALADIPGIKMAGLPADLSTEALAKAGGLRFPVFVQNPDKMRKAAQREKIILGDWYDTPLAPPDALPEKFGYAPGSCPVAEETARNIVNLSTYPLMTDGQVEKVIRFVKAHV